MTSIQVETTYVPLRVFTICVCVCVCRRLRRLVHREARASELALGAPYRARIRVAAGSPFERDADLSRAVGEATLEVDARHWRLGERDDVVKDRHDSDAECLVRAKCLLVHERKLKVERLRRRLDREALVERDRLATVRRRRVDRLAVAVHDDAALLVWLGRATHLPNFDRE